MQLLTEGRRTHYLPTLDGWRGIAVGLVVFGHELNAYLIQSAPGQFHPWMAYWGGGVGVDVFFALSGFLITNLLMRESIRNGHFSLAEFWIRRILRIVPSAYVFLLTLLLLFFLGFLNHSRAHFWSSFLFVRNYVFTQEWGGFYSGHFWSLGVEMHFYFLWPLVILFLKPRQAAVVAVIGMVLFAGWRWCDFHWHALHVSGFANEADYYIRSDIRGDGLLGGAFFGALSCDPACRAWFTRWLRPWMLPLLVGLFIVCLVNSIPLKLSINSFLLGLIICLTLHQADSLYCRWLEWKPIVWLGRISYSLYIWQQLFVPRNPMEMIYSPIQTLPWNLPLMLLVAWAAYWWIETPTAALGSKWAKWYREKRAHHAPSLPEASC